MSHKVKRSLIPANVDTRVKMVFGVLFTLAIVATVWISNREFERKLKIFPQARFLAPQTVFDRKEKINLKVWLGERNPWTEGLISKVPVKSLRAQGVEGSSSLRINDLRITGSVKKFYSEQDTIMPLEISQGSNQEVIVRADPASSGLKPGKYTLEVKIQRGHITQSVFQDFSWGVLAINTNKPTYKTGEEGLISYAVLDHAGLMVCDAQLDMTITSPSGASANFSTSDNSIYVSESCSVKSFVLEEDYYSRYSFKEPGVYKMDLKAVTFNGEYAITDYVTVTDAAPFEIERFTSTRIYPAVKYPVLIKVTPKEDFKGIIIEKTPTQFSISNNNFQGFIKYFEAKGLDGDINLKEGIIKDPVIYNQKTFKAIRWDVDWKKGNDYYLYYEYDSPDKSPDMFLLGKMSFFNDEKSGAGYEEFREWQIAVDAVTTTGWLIYGDTSAPSGLVRIRTFAAPTTFATEFSTNSGTTASNKYIAWNRIEKAPTREEMLIASLKENGDLAVHSCTTGCNANSDYTLGWTNAGTTGRQDCDTVSPLIGYGCTRAFDVGYESLGGRGLIVYSDNTADRLYYALWNGSAWAPNTTPGTPGATNQIDLPGSAALPSWVVLRNEGHDFDITRSDYSMLLVGDSAADLHALVWDGSNWSAGDTLETELETCDTGQCFDGDWYDNGSFVVTYNDTSATDLKFRMYTISSGTWSPENVATTTTGNTRWVQAEASPTTSRVAFALGTASNETRNVMFRADAVTNNFTNCAITGCPDTTSETVKAMSSAFAFERWDGEGLYLYNDAGSSNSTYYSTYTPPTSWGTRTLVGYTAIDDTLMIRAFSHQSNDNIMTIAEDVNCDINAKLWNGSGFERQLTDLENTLSNYGVTCPNEGSPASPPGGIAQVYDFHFSGYSPWSRNWRFYSDVTNTDPSTGLGGAGQNTAPSDITQGTFFRLRINVAELAAQAETNARKILQFTSGCDPNTAENTCTWTDVGDTDDTSAVFRYATTAETCAGCGDGATSSTSRLTGTNQATPVVFFVADKDAAADADFDHTASSVVEIDFPLYAQGVSSSTRYYFRIYEPSLSKTGIDAPILREQDNDGSNDCAGVSTCTYPNLLTLEIPVEPLVNFDGGSGGIQFNGLFFD